MDADRIPCYKPDYYIEEKVIMPEIMQIQAVGKKTQMPNESVKNRNEFRIESTIGKDLKLDVEKPSVIPETNQIEIEGGQKFGVSVIDAREWVDGKLEGPTFIVSMRFAASVDNEFELQKYSVMAEQVGGRLIVVDTPGFGEMASWLRSWQYLDPLNGKYDSWAKPMLQAAIKAGDLQEGEEIGLIGYSNGAFLAASQAEVLNKNHDELKKLKLTKGIHMLEPTGLHTKNPLELQATMEKYENNFNPKYFNENHELGTWVAEDEERVNPKRADISLAMAGIALGGGIRPFYKEFIADKLGIPTPGIDELNANGGMVGKALRGALDGSNNTTKLNESIITSTVASESHMTDIEQNAEVLRNLTFAKIGNQAVRSAILNVRVGETHALPLSFGRFASFGRNLRRMVDCYVNQQQAVEASSL